MGSPCLPGPPAVSQGSAALVADGENLSQCLYLSFSCRIPSQAEARMADNLARQTCSLKSNKLYSPIPTCSETSFQWRQRRTTKKQESINSLPLSTLVLTIKTWIYLSYHVVCLSLNPNINLYQQLIWHKVRYSADKTPPEGKIWCNNRIFCSISLVSGYFFNLKLRCKGNFVCNWLN